MDKQRQKLLKQQYKQRRPDLGVLCYRCAPTGRCYIGPAIDIKATQNSNAMKLASNFFPNKRLQADWNEHGAENFEIGVLETLEYESDTDSPEDRAEDLETLAAMYIEKTPNAERLKK